MTDDELRADLEQVLDELDALLLAADNFDAETRLIPTDTLLALRQRLARAIER